MDASWPFGIERAPNGERAREFVQRLPVWSNGIFITEFGSCYRRYMKRDHSCTWKLVELATDSESGRRLGYHFHGGFVSVETAIATAWHPRAPDARGRAVVLDPSREVHVDNVAWRDPEVVTLDDDDEEEETWEPLRWTIGPLSCDGLGLEISSRGRLRYGDRVTRGFAFHGTRWAACSVGLINLLAAAALQRYRVRLPPRVVAAYHSFSRGIPPDAHAELVDGTIRTAWCNYQLAAPYVARRKTLVRDWVDPALWAALESLVGDALLEASLSELHAYVSEALGAPVCYDELRLARICLR